MRFFILILLSTYFVADLHFKSDSIQKTPLPVHYSTDRFFVSPITTSGDTLMFYTDTGGGANMLYEQSFNKLQLNAEWVHQGRDSARVVEMPEFNENASIPPPASLEPVGEKLLVTENNRHPGDGFLGRNWFANRIWEFNYPEETLSLVTDIDWSARSDKHRTKLGFQVDSTGTPTTHFPRITIEIGGKSIDLLFDTGAMVRLSNQAKSTLDHEETTVSTSFISESIFRRWQEKHPNWQVIEHADTTMPMPMIKVPEIRIANHEVGPVWFTMRPDKNFTEYMSQWMDKEIKGALGGSALKYFSVIVDYPNQIAEFHRGDTEKTTQ